MFNIVKTHIKSVIKNLSYNENNNKQNFLSNTIQYNNNNIMECNEIYQEEKHYKTYDEIIKKSNLEEILKTSGNYYEDIEKKFKRLGVKIRRIN